MRHSFRSFY
ncbi:hypothetical protein FQS87_04680 [Enterococcus avium]|uniref:Uncharacterized protein n=1 Tax=Enterococcus avium TaxID=33945 RepID=A0A437USJ4_ENTAV|nr:hypothetical protein [Enterococcus avium]RVU96506.1 hypothetical protein EK398_01905 [Enterococcus avium]